MENFIVVVAKVAMTFTLSI